MTNKMTHGYVYVYDIYIYYMVYDHMIHSKWTLSPNLDLSGVEEQRWIGLTACFCGFSRQWDEINYVYIHMFG